MRGQEVGQKVCLVVFGCNSNQCQPKRAKVKVLTSGFVAVQRLVQLVQAGPEVWIAPIPEAEVLDPGME
jgi:hypothetical protein